jgi:hypothetical protein
MALPLLAIHRSFGCATFTNKKERSFDPVSLSSV